MNFYIKILCKLSQLPLFGVLFKFLLPLMANMTANDGQMTIASVEQPVRTWTLNEEADEIETTNATDASTQRSFLPGRKGGTFSAEIYADDATAETAVGGEAGVAIELIAKQGTADKKWAFNGIILSSQKVANIPGGDAVLISLSGRVNGAITPTQYTA